MREEIGEQVDEEGYKVIMELVDDCSKKIFEGTKTIQQEKFRRLQEAKNRSTQTTNGGLNAEKTVRNLSKRPLSPEETSVLALGLNFSITPRSLPFVDVITALEDTATQLPQKEAEEFRVQTRRCIERTKVPKSNLNRDMRSALRNLRHDDSIVILPADKGNVTVVMNKDDYKEKMQEVLQEGEYRIVVADPTARVEKSMNDELRHLFQSGEINKIGYDQLRTTHSVAPQLYGLPKIHKENTPMRPIVSCIGSPTYKVAKSLARIISPLTGKTSSFVRDSGDFVQKIQDFQMSSDDRLVSFDVKSLFTKVPIEEALEVIGRRLESCDDPPDTTLSIPMIKRLLRICLTSTYFMWNDEYYEQTDGAAMGNPLSPIVANIYMEYFEEMALQTTMVKPKMWLRYVDDTFVIWNGNMDELSVFHQHLNSLRPSIQFTMEEESEGQLPFLDVLVKKDDCRLITSVYRKKTHTDRYIHYTSDHHPRIKHGVIQCLMKRA